MSELLRNKFLNERESQRLYAMNPDISSSPDKFCPTCGTTGEYTWQGETRQCDCELQLQLFKHYLNAGIGVNYMRLTWNDYQGNDDLKAAITYYCDNHTTLVNKGIGFVLHGDFGVGKTMAIMLLLKEMLKLGHSVFATSFTGMIEMFTAGWYAPEEKAFYQEKIKGSQILFIDDIGKEMRGRAKLPESTFDDVLRFRVTNGRPTHITTNMPPSELREGYGAAVFSLMREVSIEQQLYNVADYRPNVMKRHIAEIDKGETRPIS